MIDYVDIIFGASWGDEGKGKISSKLAQNYDYVCRFNGGSNAGHTFYVDGKKVVTHIVPSGICYGKKSIIGPNCVVNVDDFFKEVDALKEQGFDTSLIKVSPKAHIVSHQHIEEDKHKYSDWLGTTSKGIGTCLSDKVLRTGVRAIDVFPSAWLWDEKLEGKILCEGAQSLWLDINYGNYPYVTSSECLPYVACSLGFSPKKIRNIIAVAKMYDTRSGIDPYFDLQNEETDLIVELGEEYGSTTGRKRSVKWLNLNKLRQAIEISGSTHLYLNKGDILEKSQIYKMIIDNEIHTYNDMDSMKKKIIDYLSSLNLIIEFSFTK